MQQTSKNITISCVFLLNALFGFSQQMPESYFESAYGKLEYGFFVPNDYDASRSYPVVMYLHGWSNNYTVYLNWYNEEIQAENPCFVFTPKTPTNWGDWSGWNDNALSEPMKAAIHVLDSFINVYSIDANRLYVYGISMGGEGVFDLLDKLPGKFAAGMSICGGGQEWWADNISKTPIWMFHGSADEVNPPEITERVYRGLQQMGAKRMRYTNYPGYGHNIWDRAQSEPAFYDWMFSFSKDDATCETPDAAIQLTGTVSDKISLSWNDIRNENERANKIWYYNIYNSDGIISTVEFNKTSHSFAPVLSTDIFKVNAVNYCFKESGFSNTLSYDGSLTSMHKTDSKENIRIVKMDDSIFVDGFDEDEASIAIKVISIDGKLLYDHKFDNSDNISISTSLLNADVLIVKVETKNKSILKKILN